MFLCLSHLTSGETAKGTDKNDGSVCARRSVCKLSLRGIARGELLRRGGTGGARVLGGIIGGGVSGV